MNTLRFQLIKIVLLLSGTNEVSHSRGTLYNHLLGTRRLLKRWGCDNAECYAGMIHSIYGTRIFRHITFSHRYRFMMRIVAGREAERLAFLFSTVDRPRVFFDEGRAVTIVYSESERISLLKIECANLLDQCAEVGLIKKLLQKQARALSKPIILDLEKYVAST